MLRPHKLFVFLAFLVLATTVVAQEHISVTTEDGAVLAADLYGSGTRGVVLAHGGRFTKESWKPQAETLSKAGFRVLAFDFRGFGQSHGPGDKNMFTAPMSLDVLAAVRYLHQHGARTISIVGGSFGGGAAAAACVRAKPGEISRLVMLAAYSPDVSADKIRVPLLEIVGRDDKNADGPRLPQIEAWFKRARQPKKIVVLDSAEHAQYLFLTEHGERVMREILAFLKQQGIPARK